MNPVTLPLPLQVLLPLPLLLSMALPCLLWTQGPESAPALKDAGVAADRICVPPDAADAWRAAGVTVRVLDATDIASRQPLTTPGITARAGLASPTRVPWVNANGWQLRRNPRAKYAYDVPAGRGALAAAEAFAYDADATLKIDPTDLPEVGRMLAFLSSVPPLVSAAGATGKAAARAAAAAEPKDIADVAVVDDGSPLTGEVMNLLSRRNLLFQIVKKPSPRFPINIQLGTPRYPESAAADPSAFALKIRHQLTDARRSLRIYGSEVVIARLTGDTHHVRLHLLNYGARELQGLRVRLRGTYRPDRMFVEAATDPIAPTDIMTTGGVTEFSIPTMGVYAIIDLTRTPAP